MVVRFCEKRSGSSRESWQQFFVGYLFQICDYSRIKLDHVYNSIVSLNRARPAMRYVCLSSETTKSEPRLQTNLSWQNELWHPQRPQIRWQSVDAFLKPLRRLKLQKQKPQLRQTQILHLFALKRQWKGWWNTRNKASRWYTGWGWLTSEVSLFIPLVYASNHLKVRDNRALSRASEQAIQQGVPLIAIFLLSPQDYIAHDRGARRIDFTLRNLAVLKVCIMLPSVFLLPKMMFRNHSPTSTYHFKLPLFISEERFPRSSSPFVRSTELALCLQISSMKSTSSSEILNFVNFQVHIVFKWICFITNV